MLLSILVISRSSNLINSLLKSISNATTLDKENVEILCSWNGNKINEKKIVNNSGFDFKIVQRSKYHFATNMNSLAARAAGEVLLMINDDIILDYKSIDFGLKALKIEKTGMVAGNLRYKNGFIQHVGISFDSENNPYHKFEKLFKSNSDLITKKNKFLLASTGALIFIKKNLFLDIGFNQEYETCGEDIHLSLDIREKKDLDIRFCSNVSGVHFSSLTRKKNGQYGNNKNDIIKMQNRRSTFLNNLSKKQFLIEINDLQDEIDILKTLEKRRSFKKLLKFYMKKIYLKFFINE